MTTVQTMLKWGLSLAATLLAGCASTHELKLSPPQTLSVPYDTGKGEVLWAVVPLRNESGTTITDVLEVSDKVVQAAAQVHGVRALPLNRTIATMRALKMQDLANPADAKKLAAEMGVDALIVGSITAWDPYDPPKLGLALALYARTGAMDQRGPTTIDTRSLQYQPTDYQYFPRSSFDSAPASVVSEFLDGKNHQVLMDLKNYASGRHDPDAALRWRRYLASMDLYTEFGAWHAIGRLVDHEWIRLAGATAQAK